MSHRASIAVPAGVDELYAWLHDVENWTKFLEGLDAVEPLGYNRYRWTITYARRTDTADVVLTFDPQEHRFAWRHLAGKPFDGTIRLTPVSEDRTRVDLVVDIKPVGLIDGIVEFTGRTGWIAEVDLQRLRDVVASGGLTSQGRSEEGDGERDGEAVG